MKEKQQNDLLEIECHMVPEIVACDFVSEIHIKIMTKSRRAHL